MRSRCYSICISFWLLALSWLLCAFALPDNFSAQRLLFMQAKIALQHHDDARFFFLSNLLRNYPLYPYLRYAELTEHLAQATPDAINDFLQTYADTPLAARLRNAWLQQLAQQQRWPLFLSYYRPNADPELTCWHLQALLESNQNSFPWHELPSLWLTSATLPDACTPIINAWQKSGRLTTTLIWNRLALAIVQNNKELSKNLIPLLPPTERGIANLWLKVHANPTLINQPALFLPLNPQREILLLDGIKQLAQKNPLLAVQLWPSLQAHYHFTVYAQQISMRAIALGLARANQPLLAATWLANIDPTFVNPNVREWRIRVALINQNWLQVSYWLSKLPPQQRLSSSWRYWQARALAAQQQNAAADAIYGALATQFDYYGLLASQQLHHTYQPLIVNQAPTSQAIANIAQLPAMQRAHELYYLHLDGDARREWNWQLEYLTQPQLRAAAYLAKQWGWADRTIITAAKAGDFNNLALRFPIAYVAEIKIAAKESGLDPAWLFAIIHQESGFMSDAKSSAGALGLMQVMPQTAKFLASTLSITVHPQSNYALLDANTNILLGSTYLKQLSARYADNKIIATAAYNVGPTAIKKWLPLYKTLDNDAWIETLPWRETREYVKNVMLATAAYQLAL